jgi:hypothetical protein
MRYAAPRIFTTVNASADAARTADRPTTAARTWNMPPVATPSADTTPARRPPWTLCATMYSTAGPGTTASASDASANTASVPGSGITC